MSQIKAFFNDDYSTEQKPKVKAWLDRLVGAIDNGNFFREPAVYIYRILGVLSFVMWFVFYYVIFDSYPSLERLVKDATVNMIVLILVTIALGAFCMMMWINRSNKLRARISKGSELTVLPLVADFIQTLHECVGLALMFLATIYGLYLGFVGQLFGPFEIDYFVDLIRFIVCTAVLDLIGYGFVVWGHFLGEQIRALATIANNVRDLGDIHRAATMKDEEPAAADESFSFEQPAEAEEGVSAEEGFVLTEPVDGKTTDEEPTEE